MTNTNEAILVVIDAAPAGGIADSAAELIGAASGIGAPVALATSAMGTEEELASALGELGAVKVLVADVDDTALTVPQADAVVA
ncbi:hypothetical protein JZY91_10650 [Corynebacterium sp. CNCTC7651]|nr:hypothetical protein [Corynebacterium sp. CNCTC7651]UIZ92102.1 hypothetical protein JZY91_10650 [Corynebacterium sp. CNCTC7651]